MKIGLKINDTMEIFLLPETKEDEVIHDTILAWIRTMKPLSIKALKENSVPTIDKTDSLRYSPPETL